MADRELEHERVLTGLCFEGVSGVRLKGIDRSHPGRILELLHLGWDAGCLTLTFAGGAMIRLETPGICEPWPTLSRPRHQIDADEAETGGPG